MTPQDKIIMLSRARRILEGHGRVSVSEVHDIVVRILDDEIDAYLGARTEQQCGRHPGNIGAGRAHETLSRF